MSTSQSNLLIRAVLRPLRLTTTTLRPQWFKIELTLICREADQQRMKEYMRELREMKARVSERPYLFEQVKQVSDLNHKHYITQTPPLV